MILLNEFNKYLAPNLTGNPEVNALRKNQLSKLLLKNLKESTPGTPVGMHGRCYYYPQFTYKATEGQGD